MSLFVQYVQRGTHLPVLLAVWNRVAICNLDHIPHNAAVEEKNGGYLKPMRMKVSIKEHEPSKKRPDDSIESIRPTDVAVRDVEEHLRV